MNARKYYVAKKFYRASNPENVYMTHIYAYPSKNARNNAICEDSAVMYHTVNAGYYTPENYKTISPIGRDTTITDVDICATVLVTRDEARKMCPWGYHIAGNFSALYSW